MWGADRTWFGAGALTGVLSVVSGALDSLLGWLL